MEIGGGNIFFVGFFLYVWNFDLVDLLIFIWFCRRSYEKLLKCVIFLFVDFLKGNVNVFGGCYGYGLGRFMGYKIVIVV